MFKEIMNSKMRDHIESKKTLYDLLVQRANSPFSVSTVGGWQERWVMD